MYASISVLRAVLSAIVTALLLPAGGSRLGLFELALVPVGPTGATPLALIFAVYAPLGGLAALVTTSVDRAHRAPSRRGAAAGTLLLTVAHAGLVLLAGAPPARTLLEALVYGAVFASLGGLCVAPARRRSRRRARTPGLAAAVLILATALALGAPGLWSLARAPSGERRSGDAPSRPDIVLVVLDTVRADHSTFDGRSAEITPRLAAWARDGVVFERAYSTAPWTLPAHASMLTGLAPGAHGVSWSHRWLDDRHETLAQRLGSAGYRSVAISENPFVGPSTGLDLGFDAHFGMYAHEAQSHLASALARVDRMLHLFSPSGSHTQHSLTVLRRWLAGVPDDRPVFVFLNLMAAHLPNWPRGGPADPIVSRERLEAIEAVSRAPDRFYLADTRLEAGDLSLLRSLYAAEVRHLDGAFGELLEILESRRPSGERVVAVTADHGENIGDHGFFEHQYDMHDTLLHVPLAVVAPGRIPPGVRVQRNVSTRSIAPLLETLALDRAAARRRWREQIDGPPPVAQGERVPLADIEAALGPDFDAGAFLRFPERQWAVRDGRFKLVLDSDGGARLHDLDADPDEAVDLAARLPARVDELRAMLEERGLGESRSPAGTGPAPTPDIDAATREALRALGYAAGSGPEGP